MVELVLTTIDANTIKFVETLVARPKITETTALGIAFLQDLVVVFGNQLMI